MFKNYMKMSRAVSMNRVREPSAVVCACAYDMCKPLKLCLNRYKPNFKPDSRLMVLAHVEVFVGLQGLPLLCASWF